MTKQQKIVKIAVMGWVVLVVVVVLVAVIVNTIRAGKVETTVKCAPYTAKVYVDGVEVKNNATHYIDVGEHEVMCFLAGFQVENQKVEVGETSKSILIELLPITEVGKGIQEKQMDDYYDLEAYAGLSPGVDEAAKYNEKDAKLLKFLPYNTTNFGLGMQVEGGKATVTVTTWKPGYTQMAMDKLLSLAKEAGVSLAEYEFKINGFSNQLREIRRNEASDLREYIVQGYSRDGLNVEVRGSGTVGEYRYALISVGQPSGGRVLYRALFKDGYELVAIPEPVLTVYNTPGVEQGVLDAVNGAKDARKNNT